MTLILINLMFFSWYTLATDQQVFILNALHKGTWIQFHTAALQDQRLSEKVGILWNYLIKLPHVMHTLNMPFWGFTQSILFMVNNDVTKGSLTIGSAGAVLPPNYYTISIAKNQPQRPVLPIVKDPLCKNFENCVRRVEIWDLSFCCLHNVHM